MKPRLLLIISLLLLTAGIASWFIPPELAEAGRILFRRNVFFRQTAIAAKNGSAGTNVADYAFYTQDKGGTDDYNNSGTMPTDTYKSNWTVCDSSNHYCGTGTTTADKKDKATGLVWSKWLNSGATFNWFWANNCAYPNGLPNDDGVCNTNGEPACQCVKKTSNKTGCEALGDGWRLPHQKELMQAYIDGSWGNLSSAGYYYWSATTRSNYTHGAWNVNLYYGNTNYNLKTFSHRVRCVR